MNGGMVGRRNVPGVDEISGVYSMREIADALRAGVWNDPYWANVVALLHMDGADGSTTFTDSSGKRTVTVGNSAQIDTARSKFGGASALFTRSTADYLKFDSHADWNFAAADFTVEFWVYKSAHSTGSWVNLFRDRDGDTYGSFVLLDNRLSSTGSMAFSAGTTGTSYNIVDGADVGPLPLNEWTHIAIERYGANLSLYIAGSTRGTWNIGTNALAWNSAWQPVLGGQSTPNRTLAGWIDEFRVTKGAARYRGGFMPGSWPFF